MISKNYAKKKFIVDFNGEETFYNVKIDLLSNTKVTVLWGDNISSALRLGHQIWGTYDSSSIPQIKIKIDDNHDNIEIIDSNGKKLRFYISK
mgnify:CR=1 FL=1